MIFLKGKNLFQDEHTLIRSCSDYMKMLPEKFLQASNVSDFVFKVMYHISWINEACLDLEFSDVFLVNELKLEGYCNGEVPFSYMVEVSKNGFSWITVVDYSQFRCYSVQQLYFPIKAARYTHGANLISHRVLSLFKVNPLDLGSIVSCNSTLNHGVNKACLYWTT